MTELNYVSKMLLEHIEDIKSKISADRNTQLDLKTNDIIKHLTQYDTVSFKKYGDLKIGIDYNITNDIPI